MLDKSLIAHCGQFPVLQALQERVLIWDGALATMIPVSLQTEGRPIETLSLSEPDLIESIHTSYLQAGADAVQTNSFAANPISFSQRGTKDDAYECARASVAIAHRAALRFSRPDKPRFVAGSVGTVMMTLKYERVTPELLRDAYALQVRGLLDGGVDILQFESFHELLVLECAVQAAQEVMEKSGQLVPMIAQVSPTADGSLLVCGSRLPKIVRSLEELGVDVIGINCTEGPRRLAPLVEELAALTSRFISLLPNAEPFPIGGQIAPGVRASFECSSEDFVRSMTSLVRRHGVNIAGGCCGTTPDYIRLLASRLKGSDQPS